MGLKKYSGHFLRRLKSFLICRPIFGCVSLLGGITAPGFGWSVRASPSAGWTCAVRYIRAPYRALTTLTQPPRPRPWGVNPEYP